MDMTETMEVVLAHVGVKGMRWGVRKQSTRSPEQFKKDLLSDPHPKNVDLPVRKSDRLGSGDGVSSKGHFYQTYVTPDNYLYVKYSNGDKGYSDAPGPSNTPLKLMSITGKDIKHSDIDADDTAFLAHVGVKGMRWGVRKRRPAVAKGPSKPEAVTLRLTPGKPVVAVGGRAHPPSSDAKSAAAYKQIARSSSSSALTNKQLQAVVTRMKLEQEWSKIAAAEREANKSKVRKLLEKFTKQEVAKIQQGKEPQTVVIARAISSSLSGEPGAHAKKKK